MAQQQQAPLYERSAVWKAARPFILGGSAACTATCIIQPIDMVKVQIQLDMGSGKAVQRNPVAVAGRLIGEKGFLSLYTGLSAALLRQLTYGMTRLGIFRTLTNHFAPEGGTAADIPFLTKVGCSLTAGGIGALIGTPADAALVRMQADGNLPVEQRRGYKNGVDALFRMAREEGLKGFFTGATPTIARGLSINLGMLTTYDSYKQFFKNYIENEQANRFFCGALSGWTAATLSLPFDFIKTRLQKDKPDANGVKKYKGFLDCCKVVVQEEGALAFYKGYFTYVIRITPHIMFTWVAMDNYKAIFNKFNI